MLLTNYQWRTLQVQYNQLPGGVVDAATRLSGGKAQPALQLVGSVPEVEAAIKYAFGGTLVCQVRACLGWMFFVFVACSLSCLQVVCLLVRWWQPIGDLCPNIMSTE